MNNRKRKIWLGLVLVPVLIFVSGCGNGFFEIKDSYQSYYNERKEQQDSSSNSGMALDLAVFDDDDGTTDGMKSSDYANLCINDTEQEVLAAYHCFDKEYPASMTKVMTALLVLERGDLDESVTLEHNIVLGESGAVVSSLQKGDTVSVSDLLHTMLIKSANDCAVILGEYIAGSEEKFVALMNQRAEELGATHTHFMNTNGLHDDSHYTTAYDLYLIFRQACTYDTFVDIVSSKDYTMTYTNQAGMEVKEYMESTNYYLLNEYSLPDGVVMYGGKTGTTSIAKSCLIVMTKNNDGDQFCSVVMGAEDKDQLYSSMSSLLEKTTN